MIIVAGDFHGEFGEVNTLINKRNPSIILQCGDFGWWPRFNGKSYGYNPAKVWNQFSLKNKNTKIFWCPGNHEDWYSLKEISEDKNEVMPNVYYMERGYILELPDKRKVLFMGGGLSVDRYRRTLGSEAFGWFEEENISQKDIYDLPDENIDIVISHTAPRLFTKAEDYHEKTFKQMDNNRDALDSVFKKYNPKLWYFGHMHRFQQGFDNGCKWTGLSATGFGDRWWIELEKI